MSTIKTPDFMIAGFNRSGTSTLHHLLSLHPKICMSDPKEVHFFVVNDRYNKGLEHYNDYFKNCEEGQIRGDASPTYIYKGQIYKSSIKDYIWGGDEDGIRRMKPIFPDMKMIVSLRHPVDNAMSNFEKTKVIGFEKPDANFEDALAEEERGERKPQDTHNCYLYKTRYNIHIQHLLEHYPKENILFLVFEDWTKNQQAAMDKICQFLGVPEFTLPQEDVFLNEGKSTKMPFLKKVLEAVLPYRIAHGLYLRIGTSEGYKRQDDGAKSRLLKQYYAEDIKEMEKLTGLDLSRWT